MPLPPCDHDECPPSRCLKVKTYVISYGHTVPAKWDAEMEVEAEDIKAALDKAEPLVIAEGGVIFEVRQKF